MENGLIKKVKLHFKKGTSDKVYEIYLVEEDIPNSMEFIRGKSYTVYSRWGRRINVNRSQSKVCHASYEQAEQTFEKILCKKLKKGYKCLEKYSISL